MSSLFKRKLWVIVVQSLSHVAPFLTPWIAARQSSLSFTISLSLLKFMSIELVMPLSHLILYHPLPLLPSIFPSISVVFSESAVCIRWPKYWSVSFSISSSSEYSGLISFRTDCFDLLAVQGILQSIFQQHSLKASILSCSAFFSGPTLTWVINRNQMVRSQKSKNQLAQWSLPEPAFPSFKRKEEK